MKPDPHPGAGEVGAAAGHLPVAFFPEVAHSLALSYRLASLSSGAGTAFCALAANRALHAQIKFAYTLAGYARAQSKSLSGIGQAALPAGPARDALLGTARLASSFADQVSDTAGRYGRAFGHLAFAFPVRDRRG